MERCTRSSCTRCSKKIEVLILLPLRGLLPRGARLVEPAEVARELVALDLHVVGDEHLAELTAKEWARFERVERPAEARRQRRPFGAVRVIVARRRFERALDAVQPGDDLRGDVEIRIRGRLAKAVFQSR